MNNDRNSYSPGVITMEEREILISNDSTAKRMMNSMEKTYEEEGKIVRIDSVLKRLYLAL
ncbi:MAG: hypothetical protein JXR81_07030 [Candidatus Goldbacteria bacterium]|jgi:urease accessory protein UreE|nr:hypothetical protein [Candidatus Goldiibacteriota bacterium]PKL90711.1 MAG: hypothetical protein CVV21_11200 [Candidatus Goldiibacteriota bacterium HGW-Goldbacteria-1]